jgi:hypothetical protein
MSWRDSEDAKGCDMHQALYRDDGELLGMVLRLHGGEDTYAYTVTPIGLRRLGECCPSGEKPPRYIISDHPLTEEEWIRERCGE